MVLRKVRLLIVLSMVLPCIFAHATDRQNNADYRARRVSLAKLMEGGTLVLFAPTEAEGPNNLYGFRQEDNFYYLTGWSEPGAAVLISLGADSRSYTEILFLPDHNVTQEKWTGPKLGPDDPKSPSVTGFDHVEVLDKLHEELLKILPQPRVTVYADRSEGSASNGPLEWLRRANSFPNYISFRDARPLIAHLRTVKDAGEIALVIHATDASMAAHRAACQEIHPGISERA